MADRAPLGRRLLHSHHITHPQSPSPTTSQFLSESSALQTRDFFHRTTPVKLDSAAGATGTSVAQLPGRHFIVPPWLALLVWLSILFFIALTIAGFVLSYQARKEFRMRVEEQRKAQLEAEQDAAECKIPMTHKEFNSFTRKSIMILNTNSPRVRNHPNHVYHIDNTGGLRPRNMFDRPPRQSILVAEITPSGHFSGDDPFSEFSRQMRREGLWDLAARKSKALSVASLSAIVPKMGRRHSNRFTMMDLAQEELNEQSYDCSSRKDHCTRPAHSSSLRYFDSSQGPDVRAEDHGAQPNRFVPPVPKLPVKLVKEQPNSGEKLSSFNDISFLSFNDEKKSSLTDDDETTLLHGPIHPPQRSTSRRGRGTEEPTPVERATPQTRPVDQFSPFERSAASLRGNAERGSDKQTGETPDSHPTTAARTNNVSADDVVALDASARAAAPSPVWNNDVSPDDAVAKYASARAGTPSPMPKSDVSPDDAAAKAALSRAGTPAPMSQSEVSPDDAVAKYASTRAGSVSPFPSVRRSSSVLGFLRRSLTASSNQSSDGRESPAPSTQMISYIESTTEPLPMMRRSELPPLNQSSFAESGEEFSKPFSVIIEEEDEDYFHPTRPTHSPFTPSNPSFWDTLQVRSPDTENIPLPRRLPQAALGRTPSHANRLRSHTVNSQGPISVAMTSSNSRTTSSSHGVRSRSGSSGTRGSENSPLHPADQLASPVPLTVKRNPSLSTNPYGRRKKQLDLNQHLPLSPRHHLDRHFSEEQNPPPRRTPSNPVNPCGPSSHDLESLDPNGPSVMRRTASAQARIPLSGTMSSGGVRNSSFLPS